MYTKIPSQGAHIVKRERECRIMPKYIMLCRTWAELSKTENWQKNLAIPKYYGLEYLVLNENSQRMTC